MPVGMACVGQGVKYYKDVELGSTEFKLNFITAYFESNLFNPQFPHL